MLKVRIIPCLDVDAGRVVKGVNFVDLVDAGDPVEQARIYDKAGADELCFLDITASSDDRDTIFDVVSNTAEHCFMPLTVGGGIRKIDNIRKLYQHRRGQDPRIRRPGGGKIRQPVHRRFRRCQKDAVRRVRDLYPRRPRSHRHRGHFLVPAHGRPGLR